jgi:protein gp37
MAVNTKIQWTDSTVNPTVGCDGCELWKGKAKDCYAGALTERFGQTNSGYADDFNVVELKPGRMSVAAHLPDLTGVARSDKPWADGLPRMIFVGDMSDTFCDTVAFNYLHDEVIAPIASDSGQCHQWQWLTKRPRRMAAFSRWLKKRSVSWPTNLWVGTSVTTQRSTTRLAQLGKVGGDTTIRFVSVEPQWEPIDLQRWLPNLDWVIQGGHSGSHAHPFAIEWADDLRDQCREYRVPYFLKQLGNCVTVGGVKVRGHRGQGGDWRKWPARLRTRQMPIYAGRRRLRSVKQRKVLPR